MTMNSKYEIVGLSMLLTILQAQWTLYKYKACYKSSKALYLVLDIPILNGNKILIYFLMIFKWITNFNLHMVSLHG